MATCCDSSYLEQHEHTTLYRAVAMVSGNREDEDRHTLDTSTPNSSLFLPSIEFTSATSHLSN